MTTPAPKKRAPAKKTTTNRKPPANTPAEGKKRWQELRDKSRARMEVQEPYMFWGIEPPLPIHFPTSAEKVFELQAFFKRSEVDPIGFLKILLGDQFDTVWAEIKDEGVELLFGLINDIGEHFRSWRVETQ
ncbi:hypothetical protein [Rhodococcus sp. PSBB049]|uniref:hypothetical protein n=1 Tax=Rhodococcus sp. PSBB049 TaxID=2812863 RepID=UPI00197E9BFA|nr:hypothetical protein [Rhodococcus sp. PSBB049]QSE72193.1 hypothetical protein JYA91_27870 [Rhodococcus sp. PSBB049]